MGESQNLSQSATWRQTEDATLTDIRIAADLAETIQRLGSMGELEYRYAGYRRVVVTRSADGIRTRVETRKPEKIDYSALSDGSTQLEQHEAER